MGKSVADILAEAAETSSESLTVRKLTELGAPGRFLRINDSGDGIELAEPASGGLSEGELREVLIRNPTFRLFPSGNNVGQVGSGITFGFSGSRSARTEGTKQWLRIVENNTFNDAKFGSSSNGAWSWDQKPIIETEFKLGAQDNVTVNWVDSGSVGGVSFSWTSLSQTLITQYTSTSGIVVGLDGLEGFMIFDDRFGRSTYRREFSPGATSAIPSTDPLVFRDELWRIRMDASEIDAVDDQGNKLNRIHFFIWKNDVLAGSLTVEDSGLTTDYDQLSVPMGLGFGFRTDSAGWRWGGTTITLADP